MREMMEDVENGNLGLGMKSYVKLWGLKMVIWIRKNLSCLSFSDYCLQP